MTPITQGTLVSEEHDTSIQASDAMHAYFERFRKDTFDAFMTAQKARARGYDPEEEVSVALAKTLAERVIGLISVIVPQIKNAGVERRIEELEREHGILDWRVAFTVALEIAQKKFCAFETEMDAITAGVRVGFAYITLGVVSAPLEGLSSIEVKERLDRSGKYFCLNFAGPIRNAGGTAASVCVLIADYVRVHMGYTTYDPTEKEILRCPAEIRDYHEYITNLQYFPSEQESIFLMRNLPVEISGDASEKYEIANINLKDLPRVPTNKLRSGYCLIHSSCIPLKAPKLWKQLSKWGQAYGMGHWGFLKEFLELQKKMKSGTKTVKLEKIVPDYTYLKDLVAGRPVLAYPLRPGGFRLRYGRSRASGYSGQAIHPCTMHVLNDYIASATQLKVERPGKAAAFMPCDTIDGPIVKLKDGRVLQLQEESIALEVKNQITDIIYLGDVLINYGDFFDRNHNLVPAGYCPEWWIQEIERMMLQRGESWNPTNLATITTIPEEVWVSVFVTPLRVSPTAAQAITIAEKTNTPLHPAWTPFWSVLSPEQITEVFDATQKGVFANTPSLKLALEILGVPHHLEGTIILEEGWNEILRATLQNRAAFDIARTEGKSSLELVQAAAPFIIRDKAGIFIGARMGRPEKAKMRKLTGSPHCLFPIGEEGGRLRSVQEALVRGKVTAEFPARSCEKCKTTTVFGRCEVCDSKTELKTLEIKRYDGTVVKTNTSRQEVDVRRIFEACLHKLDFKIYPDLIKGVRGTSNKSHIPEHLIKGILRAKWDIAVNKDGTTRYDSSEVALTHFTPQEARVSVVRLKELGYTHDCYGKELQEPEQVLELRPQDILLPCCPTSPDEPADEVLFRIASFIDEELQALYGLAPYYRLKTKDDLVGHYIVGLAPHTSAGIVGRVVGFSKTQGFLAHPLFHAAMRRDCDGDESCFILLMDAFLNFSSKFLPESRGSTMDAPLVVTYFLNPAEVDDMAFHVDRVWKYPIELYEASLQYTKPYDIKVEILENVLGTPSQFEGMGFTHGTTSINAGVLCSAYKLLPSMQEKLFGQMDLAKKIRACDASAVAQLVIEKHFIRDIKGNLRKFTQQEYRCVHCNEKFRRPPLIGKCTKCGGKIIFTISEGSVIKYLEPSLTLAHDFNVPTYLQQDLELLRRKVEDLFGKDKEKQMGLAAFGA